MQNPDEVSSKNHNNPNLTGFSQNLLKNMTKEEKHLWYDFQKDLPITENRQKVIGNYIVDFYIASAKIVIELDGSQHFDDKNMLKDEKRDDYFLEKGITVLRYTNLEIARNFKDVCQDIWNHLDTSSDG